MNIRAVMAALDEWTLSRTDKHALIVLCCRADRHSVIAEVSVARLAADMSVHYDTAARALSRLTSCHLVHPVEKRPGRTTRWKVNLADLTRGVPPATDRTTPRVGAANPPRLDRDVGVEGEEEGGAAAPAGMTGRVPSPGEKARAADPAAIAACEWCDEYGWLWRADGVIEGRCSHVVRRKVTALTVPAEWEEVRR